MKEKLAILGVDTGLSVDHAHHGSVTLQNKEEAYYHLLAHRKVGHSVPQYAIDRLKEESGIDN